MTLTGRAGKGEGLKMNEDNMDGDEAMTEFSTEQKTPGWQPHRLAIWAGVIAAILMVPLIAMQFTGEVNWTPGDFIFAAIMLSAVAIPYELAVRSTGNASYKIAVAIALAVGFLIVWINLAVGIIGSEDNPANQMFFAVLLVPIAGALFVRFRPTGMARTMVATAIAQAATAVIALVMGHFTFVIVGVWAAMWLASAWLFRKAARERDGTTP